LGWFQRGTGYEVRHSSLPIPRISEAKKKWEANPSLYYFYLSLQFSFNFSPAFDISALYESAFDFQPIFSYDHLFLSHFLFEVVLLFCHFLYQAVPVQFLLIAPNFHHFRCQALRLLPTAPAFHHSLFEAVPVQFSPIVLVFHHFLFEVVPENFPLIAPDLRHFLFEVGILFYFYPPQAVPDSSNASFSFFMSNFYLSLFYIFSRL
jgi:hypothetical protein